MDPRPIDFEIVRLLTAQRWASLAVVSGGEPAASMVAYAVEPAGSLLLFLSGLAAHTRALLESRQAALAVSAPDLGAGDPQELPRISLHGEVVPLGRETAEFAAAWPVYAGRFPAAVPRLSLADFGLFRMSPAGGRYVDGFARAVGIRPELLAAALAAAGGE